jgi:alkylhydroperoxidase/carboxymuconolactone decarboxylase family protein YurZ
MARDRTTDEGLHLMTERPLLDTLTDMTAASVERTDLSARELMLVRLGALAAVHAPPASYLLNIGPAADSGLTLEDAQSVLVAVAPIVGAPTALAAAGAIFEALGLAVAVLDAELEALEDEE